MSYPVFDALHFDDLGCECKACGPLCTPVHLAKPAPTEAEGHGKRTCRPHQLTRPPFLSSHTPCGLSYSTCCCLSHHSPWANPEWRKSLLHHPQSCDLLYSRRGNLLTLPRAILHVGIHHTHSHPTSLLTTAPPVTPATSGVLFPMSCFEGLLHPSSLMCAVACIPGRPLFFQPLCSSPCPPSPRRMLYLPSQDFMLGHCVAC